MKIINKGLAFCLVVLFCGIVTSDNVLAVESGGGQVSTNSKITFYSDDSKPTPTPTPKATPTPKSGILPQTGESVGYYSLVGMVILITLFVVFVKKRGRQKYEK